MAGVSPQFSPLDVARSLLILSDKPQSRAELVEQLELGEGSIRSILNELKLKKWVYSSRKGHTLSTTGLKVKRELRSRLAGPLTVDCEVFNNPFHAAIKVKRPHMAVNPVKLRDVALQWGADAALVLVMKGNALQAPAVEGNLNVKDVKNLMKPEEGDLIVITFANSKAAAVTSALAVAVRADPWLRGWMVNHVSSQKGIIKLP